jgi:hypothetical protein
MHASVHLIPEITAHLEDVYLFLTLDSSDPFITAVSLTGVIFQYFLHQFPIQDHSKIQRGVGAAKRNRVSFRVYLFRLPPFEPARKFWPYLEYIGSTSTFVAL